MDNNIVFIAGPCVIESQMLLDEVASDFCFVLCSLIRTFAH